MFFCRGCSRVFERDQYNCYFDSSVKSTNVPQNKFWSSRAVVTGTIYLVFDCDLNNEKGLSLHFTSFSRENRFYLLIIMSVGISMIFVESSMTLLKLNLISIKLIVLFFS